MILDVENRLGKLDSGSFLTNNDFGQKFNYDPLSEKKTP